MKERKIENIPQGIYCWDSDGICPYWSLQKDKSYRENGYCHFLQKGDGTFDDVSYLWNQVKKCNMFTRINEYEYSIKSNTQRFFKKIFLFRTIPEFYSFFEKIKILFIGKICLCKFCNNYFIQLKDANNLTICVPCFIKRMQKG